MNILILGGTGAIGDGLVKSLINSNNEIFVTTRKDIPSFDNLHYIKGNAKDNAFLREVLSYCHWNCIVDFMAYGTEEFRQRINDILSHTNQYVFLSSARVYDFDTEHITELSPRNIETATDKHYLRSHDYSLEKARQEDILKSSDFKNWTIIRPYKTFSNNRFQLGFLEKEDWLYRVMKGRTLVFSRDLCEKYTTISSTNVVACYLNSLIGNKVALNNIFQIAVGDSITWGEILNIYISSIEQQTGKPVKVVLSNSAYDIWKGKPDFTIQYDTIKNHFFDNKKIEQVVDVPETLLNNRNDLVESIKAFMLNPKFGRINWIQQARFDRLCHETAKLSEINSVKQRMQYVLFRHFPVYSIFKLMRKIRYYLT